MKNVRASTVRKLTSRVRVLGKRVEEVEEMLGQMQRMTPQAPLPDTRMASAMELAEEIIVC